MVICNSHSPKQSLTNENTFLYATNRYFFLLQVGQSNLTINRPKKQHKHKKKGGTFLPLDRDMITSNKSHRRLSLLASSAKIWGGHSTYLAPLHYVFRHLPCRIKERASIERAVKKRIEKKKSIVKSRRSLWQKLNDPRNETINSDRLKTWRSHFEKRKITQPTRQKLPPPPASCLSLIHI